MKNYLFTTGNSYYIMRRPEEDAIYLRGFAIAQPIAQPKDIYDIIYTCLKLSVLHDK